MRVKNEMDIRLDKSTTRSEKWPWRITGLVLTAAYAGAVCYLVYRHQYGFWHRVIDLELNALGDMLAGLFAPLAFLWLFVATMIQGQELKDNRLVMQEQADAAASQVEFLAAQAKTMQEQGDVAREVAAANYQLALYDKRLDLSNRLDDVGLIIFTEGSISRETRRKIYEAAKSSKWLFDDNIKVWLAHLGELSQNSMRADGRLSRLIKKCDLRGWTDEDESARDALFAETGKLNDELERELEPVNIDKRLAEFLRLPPSVARTMTYGS